MKSYTFSKVSARGYLTEADYKNKYIITEDLKLVLNMSDKRDLERMPFFKDRGIVVYNLPLTENDGDMGYKNFLFAVKHLLSRDHFGGRSLVCCDFGVNRSRTVIEGFHYAKMGCHFEDEYKGYTNHLIYNCENGHLPPLPEVELQLERLRNDYLRGDACWFEDLIRDGVI